MTQHYGIDTSILVRLVTGDPEDRFDDCVEKLTDLVEKGSAVFASNQVIGEAYIVLQHHYGLDKASSWEGLSQVLKSGLVRPLNGLEVFPILSFAHGCGLLDRLIANDYAHRNLGVLTLDKKMAALDQSFLL
uniref:Predicted nucleic acid-binding protein, contains PIN domain n=1 Tax=Candidatus Kentrum sp. LFY TaxID=2126342 RepID=A0A450USS4_9GAMM|nr:MAG: Predicted nucleic acid-binding protein, contains PIN domain [Candidatus Kentron sp. LFY]